MDRFIEYVINHLENISKGLKSNMDRFIVVKYGDTTFKREGLKSNMDRFIAPIPNAN